MATFGDVIILFGGIGTNPYYLSDTWQWDGMTWTPLTVDGPPARYDHTMVSP
jgi:hypothetical protein